MGAIAALHDHYRFHHSKPGYIFDVGARTFTLLPFFVVQMASNAFMHETTSYFSNCCESWDKFGSCIDLCGGRLFTKSRCFVFLQLEQGAKSRLDSMLATICLSCLSFVVYFDYSS